MKEVLVFSTQFIGLVEIPETEINDGVIIFKNVKSKTGKLMSILYFNDLEYGVVISDEIVKRLES